MLLSEFLLRKVSLVRIQHGSPKILYYPIGGYLIIISFITLKICDQYIKLGNIKNYMLKNLFYKEICNARTKSTKNSD